MFSFLDEEMSCWLVGDTYDEICVGETSQMGGATMNAACDDMGFSGIETTLDIDNTCTTLKAVHGSRSSQIVQGEAVCSQV